MPATAPAGFDAGQLTQISGNGSTDFLSQVPAQFQPILIDGFHRALTISIANSIWLGVVAAAVAPFTAFLLKEIPLRTTQRGPARRPLARERTGAAGVSLD